MLRYSRTFRFGPRESFATAQTWQARSQVAIGRATPSAPVTMPVAALRQRGMVSLLNVAAGRFAPAARVFEQRSPATAGAPATPRATSRAPSRNRGSAATRAPILRARPRERSDPRATPSQHANTPTPPVDTPAKFEVWRSFGEDRSGAYDCTRAPDRSQSAARPQNRQAPPPVTTRSQVILGRGGGACFGQGPACGCGRRPG